MEKTNDLDEKIDLLLGEFLDYDTEGRSYELNSTRTIKSIKQAVREHDLEKIDKYCDDGGELADAVYKILGNKGEQ